MLKSNHVLAYWEENKYYFVYLCLFTALRQDRIISSQKVRKVCTSGSWCTVVFHSSTIGESQAISVNATAPEKQTQRLCIQKVDANSRRGELL